MADDPAPQFDKIYSAFGPSLIVVIGLLIWFGFQDYELYNQHSTLEQKLGDTQLQANVNAEKKFTNRYLALMNDLYQTAQRDSVAAQIVKDALKVGLLQGRPAAPDGAIPGEPPPAK